MRPEKMKEVSQKELIRDHQPEAMKKRLLLAPRSQYISDAVLGGIDGCVTTFAVVSGAFGAGFPSTVAVVLGFANLIADGFSMGISNYESNTAKREFIESIRSTEERHIKDVPEGELEEIRQIFQTKGFEGEILEKIVDTISQDKNLWIETMLTEEHGIDIALANPWLAAWTTFCSFIFVGSVPLLPFFISALPPHQQFMISAGLAGAMFFLIGTLKSLVLAKPIFVSGLRTLLTGGTAAGLAFLTGYVLREAFGI